jgi:hypothetical protein
LIEGEIATTRPVGHTNAYVVGKSTTEGSGQNTEVAGEVTTTITGTITDGLFKGRLPATLVLRLSFGARMPLAGAGPSATGPAPIHCRPRT